MRRSHLLPIHRLTLALTLAGGGAALSLFTATQFIASAFDFQQALGPAALSLPDVSLYPPWSILSWRDAHALGYPKPFLIADVILTTGAIATTLVCAFVLRPKASAPAFGADAWAKFEDVVEAQLFAQTGAILGAFDKQILAYNGPEHQILIGASRSGKGRGHVVPTLLAWPESALVFDVKGELDRGDARHGFPGTSGFRAKLGPVRRFAPTNPTSDCFNPLLEVRRGPNEIRDVQNIVETIVDWAGQAKGSERFWNDTAKVIITGVILHVLYAEPVERKTLAVVREKLRDLGATAQAMRTTLHRLNPDTSKPEVHPEVLHAAESYLAGEERLRSGIKATAESFFGVFADPLVAQKTATSSFRLSDLMSAETPMTLYLQPPPSDAQRLMPLMRLVITLAMRALMEDQTHDAQGRRKRHRLLFLIDEFPQLGRMHGFETALGACAGYGIKVAIICQSLNHVIQAYGRDNTILDNCHIVQAFAAADTETAKRIAEMAGEVWEVRESETKRRSKPIFGSDSATTTSREERRPLLLVGDVRALPRDEQLIFVSGAKPIRAKKLRFDQEAIFKRRLVPVAPPAAIVSVAHDWTDAATLGTVASNPVSEHASKRPGPKPTQPDVARAQGDLFATAVDAARSAPPHDVAPRQSAPQSLGPSDHPNIAIAPKRTGV